jgi:hypothetical protein
MQEAGGLQRALPTESEDRYNQGWYKRESTFLQNEVDSPFVPTLIILYFTFSRKSLLREYIELVPLAFNNFINQTYEIVANWRMAQT